MLAQDNDQGKEQAIHYLRRILTPVEIRYSPIEKLCLVLYFSVIKLRHYMLPSVVHIISQTNLIKYMLTQPIIKSRIGKWTMALSEFTFKYMAQKSVKGQALAQFLADHPSVEIEDMENVEIDTAQVGQMYHEPWLLYFDGSSTSDSAGAGIVIESPTGQKHQYAFKLDFNCTNNKAEYEALIIRLEVLEELGATRVKVFGDSLLVINQMLQVFRCSNLSLATYYAAAQQLLSCFHDVEFHHLPRELNREANEMAQIASGVSIPAGQTNKIITIERNSLPSLAERGMPADVFELDVLLGNWRFYITQHLLMKTDGGGSRKIRMLSSKFTIKNGELLRKIPDDDLLLRCLGSEDAQLVMAEVHEGICGAHQAGIKMRWLIRRHGYYWPTILKDCIEYARGCAPCQLHGSIQRAPAFPMNPIVKPWPFRGWAMDIIGQISPPSSKQHIWILVATYYFTKWVEAVPFTSISSVEVIKFIEQNIIHCFGIPETITTDRGSVFIAESVTKLMAEYMITMQQSTPYYAQANGQAEATNKVLIQIVEKMIQENPRDWHNLLSETLWAYQISKRSATGTTPFALTYGHDAILSMEMTVRSLRVAMQNNLTADEYSQAMLQELEDLDQARLDAYDQLQAQKKAVARACNKKTRYKSFGEGELVWKVVLPIGTKDPRFGKWSPNWEGPFIIDKVLGKGAYHLRDKDGERHAMPINSQYLKKYYPTMWEARATE
ncbi:putative ribonuclease H-like domain-containing protein [Rosa chinensis]|uniref:Putative ribonuclease H-like domain-containing protein n=1 Tax=Rosa chinensis TaxID=74649 RepID=A0A2P6QBX0_ROSCH|nr:putative ribonuclease H-like domain-containing protein [Rosa chinensis]